MDEKDMVQHYRYGEEEHKNDGSFQEKDVEESPYYFSNIQAAMKSIQQQE